MHLRNVCQDTNRRHSQFAIRVGLLALALALGILGSDLFAGVHFVGPSGSNQYSKMQTLSRSTPWRTLQHAVNQLEPGDQIRVLDGTYYEHVWLPSSGQKGKWISLVADNRGGAKLVGSISAQNRSYVLIKGLDVSNPDGDFVLTKGIAFSYSHHITIRGNIVHDCFGGGISCDQSDSVVIDWNEVHHNAFWDGQQHSGISVYQPQRRGPQDDRFWGIVIRNNVCWGNQNLLDNPYWGRPTDGNGIVADDFKNLYAGGNGTVYDRWSVIENNVCFQNGGQGVHCYQSANVYIRNNTCSENVFSFDFGGEVSVVDSDNVMVYNNILDASPGKYAALQYESSNYWFAYNLVNGSLRAMATGRGNLFGPPRFQEDSYRLLPDSPAINRGLTQNGLYPMDAAGNPRIVDGSLDIGAYEFGW